MGNLIVEAYPVFGGGHFRSSGVGTGGGTFEFIIDEVEISVVSAGDVFIDFSFVALPWRATLEFPCLISRSGGFRVPNTMNVCR